MPRGPPPRRRELRARPAHKSPSPRKTRQAKPSAADGLDQDKILELWAQFTADHYEMVEQLPLELHRNSRLLKEMDQESVGESAALLALLADTAAQQEKLERRIREYIAWRVELARPKQAEQPPDTKPADLDTHSDEDAAERELFPDDEPAERAEAAKQGEGEAETGEAGPSPERAASSGAGAPSAASAASAEVKTELVDHADAPASAGPAPAPAPAPDLASQLFPPDSPRRGSPSRSRSRVSSPPGRRPDLGAIAALVDDLVRNREEKVAIAVGAYNNVSESAKQG